MSELRQHHHHRVHHHLLLLKSLTLRCWHWHGSVQMTNQHKRDSFPEDTWLRSLHNCHKSAQVPNGFPLVFFEFYFFYWWFEIISELLRNCERFWEIVRNFEKFLAIFFKFYLLGFCYNSLLPHGIAGICFDNGWSHSDLILASGVGVAATPWQLTPLHHEEKEDTCYSAIVLHFHCLLAVYLYIVSGLENFYNLSFMMDDHVYIIQHIIHVGYTCATEMLT